ncbi:MATH domain and coiled-coil domain-containing protein At3g58270-like [Manihot esculenta]|uniref:MATH domain and coiled-coil domain-containing protein At3g58270-like n=1 Tax=Manihot esculenta TaxID=3983 RepID=UPI001CC81D2F|nr:MATH domain and coiled-coil domain-containing protein At3g58270-like [Manihot esculenta]
MANNLRTAANIATNEGVIISSTPDNGQNTCLLLFPKGNNVNHLSIYLDVADSTSLPQGWIRDAKISFAVKNQLNNSLTVREDTRHVFQALAKDWGFKSFIPLGKIKDSAEGNLVGNMLLVEVEVLVHSIQHYSRLDPTKEVARNETKPSEPVIAPQTNQVPLLQNKVVDTKANVVSTTVIEAPLTTKPLNRTIEGIQTGIPTNDKEVIKYSPPPSMIAETIPLMDHPFEPRKPSPNVHTIYKGLL